MSDDPTLSVREEKHRATSLRVERNAVDLVLRHGFDAVTVDMICEASAISQRTFFNYFKTKDAAVIGAEPPTVDEGKARVFIAGAETELLPELLALMTSTVMNVDFDEKLFADRFQVFGQNPRLMHKQMERMSRVTIEVAELVYLRLHRAGDSHGARADDAEMRERAALLTHAMFGVLRFVATRWVPAIGAGAPGGASASPPSSAPDPAPTRAESLEYTLELLRRTLRTA